nr:phage minor capsid protein [Rhodococcus qingshengii]
MALDPSEAAGLPDELIALYSEAELALMSMLAHAIVAGIDTPEWEARQPAEMLRFRQQAQLMALQLQAQMPALVEGAVAGAAVRGREAADEDLKALPKVPPIPPATPDRDRKTRAAIFAGQQVLSQVTARIPGAAGELHTQVTTQIVARHSGQSGTRIDAAQQALDILTKRGVTGFRDAAGRNWSLSSYIEMKSRTIVNQELIDGHTDRMLERGQTLIVVSSHSNPAPQCQPFEGQVLSLDGETGTVIRPNATGGRAVKVKIKATLKDARSKGFQHPNCGHAVSAFIPGASRTFTTDPDPKGYEAEQKQRAMERAIRETKRSQSVAVTPARKKELAARLTAQRAALAQHVDDNNLKRLPARESIAGVHRFGRPVDPGAPSSRGPIGPVTPPPVPPRTGGGGGDDGDGGDWEVPKSYKGVRGAENAPFAPSDRPPFEPEDREHILDGDPEPPMGAGGGGHRYGTRRKGKTEFPNWSDERVMDVADRTLAAPQRIVRQEDGSLAFFGYYDGIVTFVVAESSGRDWHIRTAHPLSGDGVRNFDGTAYRDVALDLSVFD